MKKIYAIIRNREDNFYIYYYDNEEKRDEKLDKLNRENKNGYETINTKEYLINSDIDLSKPVYAYQLTEVFSYNDGTLEIENNCRFSNKYCDILELKNRSYETLKNEIINDKNFKEEYSYKKLFCMENDISKVYGKIFKLKF